MSYILNDDSFKNFFPLTYYRYSFELIIGALSNALRLKFLTNKDIFFITSSHILHDYLNENFKIKEYKENYEGIILSSNFIVDENFLNKIENINKKDFIIISNGKIIGYSSKIYNLKNYKNAEKIFINVNFIKKPYDLIKYNKERLLKDLILLSNIFEKVKISSNIIGKFPIISNGKFEMETNIFFDTRNGPIFIGNNAYLQAFSRIEGPSYIGDNTNIITGSNIRRSYIGKNCVIGGEITNSIILDYVNSRHSSYIGDSYICSWVNIGAHSIVSNLKNTYGEIKYDNIFNQEKTNMKKLGVIIADHAKISIGCSLFSGKVVGFSSHVHYNLKRSIPSFCVWFGDKEEGYEMFFESAIETARRFMRSKNIDFTSVQYEIFKKIFEITENERKKFGIKKEKFLAI